MSHNGWSNAYNWKGYKTPFRRSGHKFTVHIEYIQVCNAQLLSSVTSIIGLIATGAAVSRQQIYLQLVRLHKGGFKILKGGAQSESHCLLN